MIVAARRSGAMPLALVALVLFGRLFVGTLKRFYREENLVRWRR